MAKNDEIIKEKSAQQIEADGSIADTVCKLLELEKMRAEYKANHPTLQDQVHKKNLITKSQMKQQGQLFE